MIFNIEIATEPTIKAATIAFTATGIAFIATRSVDPLVSIVGIVTTALVSGLLL